MPSYLRLTLFGLLCLILSIGFTAESTVTHEFLSFLMGLTSLVFFGFFVFFSIDSIDRYRNRLHRRKL